jgi:septum formation protein
LVPVLDKAGAYGIQEHGDILVESIEGELENIIGLPVGAITELFRSVGILPAAAKGE